MQILSGQAGSGQGQVGSGQSPHRQAPGWGIQQDRVLSLSLLVLFGCAESLLSWPVQAEESRRPNVIIIYTDDQGSVDLHCYGAEDLTTPHLDALAKKGVRFTQFYSAAPVCSPSRAALLTGRVPQRAGLAGNASSQRGSHRGLPTEQITLAELLQQAGYATGHIGKWHLGYIPQMMPQAQGFDVTFGHMGGCIDNYSHFFYWQGPNRHDLWKNGREIWRDGEYFPDLMVQEACAFLETNQHQPFFLYLAFNTPHYPLQGEAKWRQHYQNLPSPRNKYAAFVSTTDDKIGQVLAKLDALKLRQHTLVIFQSDHGHSTEIRTFGGGGSAGPYRGAKFSLFEGGIRVPAMISWPGQLPQGEVRDQFATACDWFPTVLELCRLPSVKHQIDGKSLLPVLRKANARSPHPWFCWESGGPPKRRRWAVRQGDWKLLGNPVDTTSGAQTLKAEDSLFLVDLSQDISETKNLAASKPEKVAQLQSLYRAWRSDVLQTSVESVDAQK